MMHPGPHSHEAASALHPAAGFDPLLLLVLALALAGLIYGVVRLGRDHDA